MICPNLSIPDIKKEFDELKSVVGEDMAYLIWDRNNGYHLDKTSDGKPSKLFNDLLGLTDRKKALEIKAKTLSKSFKTWFGDSKVVDENGEPLIVYHGSSQIFEKFDLTKTNPLKNAFYFDDRRENIQNYGNVLPVFLQIKTPNTQFIKSETAVDFLQNLEFNQIKQINQDGVIGTGIFNDTQYIVFEPNQIKSIFNSGVFNRYSDNIYDNDILVTEQNRQQTSINGSMAKEIVSNFENYFPDYNYFNDEQRQIVANLVEQGKLQLSCSI